jgi:hypothetical protein
VELVDNDMGDAAKENLRRKHMHLCNHHVFIHKTVFIMVFFCSNLHVWYETK